MLPNWSGRPVEVDSDQIETLIENNQHYTMWEIANVLKISKSIKLLVKMKTVFYLWKKPHGLFGSPNNTHEKGCLNWEAEIPTEKSCKFQLNIPTHRTPLALLLAQVCSEQSGKGATACW